MTLFVCGISPFLTDALSTISTQLDLDYTFRFAQLEVHLYRLSFILPSVQLLTSAQLSPVSVAFEMEPQLEDVVVKLTSESSFVRVLPLAIHNLECYILYNNRNSHINTCISVLVHLSCSAIIFTCFDERMFTLTLRSFLTSYGGPEWNFRTQKSGSVSIGVWKECI